MHSEVKHGNHNVADHPNVDVQTEWIWSTFLVLLQVSIDPHVINMKSMRYCFLTHKKKTRSKLSEMGCGSDSITNRLTITSLPLHFGMPATVFLRCTADSEHTERHKQSPGIIQSHTECLTVLERTPLLETLSSDLSLKVTRTEIPFRIAMRWRQPWHSLNRAR